MSRNTFTQDKLVSSIGDSLLEKPDANRRSEVDIEQESGSEKKIISSNTQLQSNTPSSRKPSDPNTSSVVGHSENSNAGYQYLNTSNDKITMSPMAVSSSSPKKN